MSKKTRRKKETECRVCGCTQSNCSGCIARTGIPCWWTEVDLCSACTPHDKPRDIARTEVFINELTVGDAHLYSSFHDTEYLIDMFIAVRRQLRTNTLSHNNTLRSVCAYDYLDIAKKAMGAYADDLPLDYPAGGVADA